MIKFDDDGVILTETVLAKFLRTQYNYDRDQASLQSGLACNDATRTQQQFGEECDINTIVERFGLTGQLPINNRVPLVGEFTEVYDYQSSLNKLREADESFMRMPASIRERFKNDPGAFVDFVSNPANREEVKKMGLGRPETPLPAPIEVRVVPSPSDGEKKD